MTSPIYPPQGGSSKVWRIKLSPKIKRLLAQYSHEGTCTHSPYVFQSCCTLFDIINIDQGILRGTQTDSPPMGNISLSNTDMIYADFNTWLYEIPYSMWRETLFYSCWKARKYRKSAGWCESVQYAYSGISVCSVYVVTIQKRILPRGVFAEANCVRSWPRGYASPQMHHLHPHKLPHIPKWAWSGTIQFFCSALVQFIHFHTLAGTQKQKDRTR